jgi:ATPase subunit of ABC transporter with duplicated ATPase domains
LEFLNPLVNVICHVENKNIVRYTGNYDLFVKTFETNQNKLVSSYMKQQKQINEIQTFIDKNSARASTSKRAKSKQKALDKIERIELNEKTQVPNFTFKEDRKPSKVVLETKDLVIGYETALTKPLNLTIERGSKIAIIGTNGLGKTTLLKSLININKPISGDAGLGQFLEIGYFEQESKKSSLTCLEDV